MLLILKLGQEMERKLQDLFEAGEVRPTMDGTLLGRDRKAHMRQSPAWLGRLAAGDQL